MLTQTSFAVSHDETRYAPNGVLIAFQGKDVWMVATDGHRLALSTRSLGKAISSATGIVPRKAVTEIMRVLGAGEEVQLAITENQFVMQMPNFVMTARLIEGQFPGTTTRSFLAPTSGRLAAPRNSLSAALRRVAVMAEERNKPVKLALSPGSLKVSAQSQELGEAEEILEVEYAGEDIVDRLQLAVISLEAMAALEEGPGGARNQGCPEPRSDQKRRGRWVLPCVISQMRI